MARPDTPRRDLLEDDAPLPYVVELPVLGVRVRFECGTPAAADAIESSYGWWRPLLQAPRWLSGAGARIRILVRPGEEPTLPHPRVSTEIPQPDHLLIRSAGSEAWADAAQGEGMVHVTTSFLETGETFRTAVLDAVTLWLVTRLDRVPVHAAMVARRGNAVLLAAPGGVGKSTLAYLARRAGYEVPADDVTYVQLDPELRAWGAARMFRLPLAATRWFGELATLPPTMGADGDPKLVVPMRVEAAPVLPPQCRVAVCQVTRTGSPATLEPRDPAALAQALSARLDPGFDRFRDRMGDVTRPLCARGGWRLNLSDDPRQALLHLDRMLAELEAQP
jgi:hypothetical protein